MAYPLRSNRPRGSRHILLPCTGTHEQQYVVLICLLLLFYRIFSPDRIFRYKLYGAFAFIATTTLSSIPMYLAICLPSSKGSWAESQTKCGKTSVYCYVQGPAAVIFDLFMFHLPTSVIVHLHKPLRRKIGVLAIFMTGHDGSTVSRNPVPWENEYCSLEGCAVVASIVGLVFRVKLIHDLDSTWASYIVEFCLYVPHSNSDTAITRI